MAVTPNYGWPVPVATDYVKDGWEAISDLGNAIDTTVAGLGSGLKQIVPSSIVKGASGSASVSAGGAVTFSGTESIALNDVFNSTYQNYQIMVVINGSTAMTVNNRLRVSGTDASGTDYHLQNLSASAATVSGARTSSATSIALGECATPDSSSIIINVFRPNLAVPTLFISQNLRNAGTTTPALQFNTGQHTLSTAYTGITFIASTGTFTGNIRVYGFQNG